MKKNINIFLLFMFLSVISLSAQGMRSGGMGFMFPDTLAQITLSGKVTVDTSLPMPIYYLDINGDNTNDCYLNFGPIWYTPDNSTAVRPKTGDQITIIGGQMNTSLNMNGLPMIIVYKIDGLLWRDPFDPMWNDFGNNTHMMGQHAGNCSGYAFGASGTKPQDVTLSGRVLVDTTYFMDHYYLDENNDGEPDYFLNFGPWWYESSTGATRPNNGDNVTIVGGKLQATNGLSVVIVYQINGKVWRDPVLIGNNFGGGWMRKNNSNDKVTNPFDDKDFMMMGSGWNMGGMMSDSMFARMLELNPYNMPNGKGQNIFKGYEMGIFNSNGSNGMMQNGGCGGMMNFGANGNIQFHFDDKQIQAYHIDKNSLRVKYWNNQTNQWTTIINAVINHSTNTITFSNSQIASYYILTSDNVTFVEESTAIPTGYSLGQNYPNPFNPSTNISYQIPVGSNVTLKVFDLLGEEVATLVDEFKSAGSYNSTFSIQNYQLPSGVYFYQLTAGSFTATKKFILMK
ncbi:MAG: T9SS type A sorting domain-containing protein [Ignavibacteriales bacterium]|nr:T9SS type A sorting domain-containing protein [Ignavibacteriales bacterium]